MVLTEACWPHRRRSILLGASWSSVESALTAPALSAGGTGMAGARADGCQGLRVAQGGMSRLLQQGQGMWRLGPHSGGGPVLPGADGPQARAASRVPARHTHLGLTRKG